MVTVTVRALSQPCPVPFDTAAYARQVAATMGVVASRVHVHVVCHDLAPSAVLPGGRLLQTGDSELTITVEVDGVTSTEASLVRRLGCYIHSLCRCSTLQFPMSRCIS